MSTTPTNYELDAAPVDAIEVLDVPEADVLPAAEPTPVEEAPKKSGSVWSQICAILLAIIALVPFILPIGVVTTSAKGDYAVGNSMSLIGVITQTISGGTLLAPASATYILGLIYDIALYALVVSGVVAVILAVIALINKGASTKIAKASATVVALISACYTLCYASCLAYWGAFDGNVLKYFEIIPLAMMALSFLLYVILCGVKAGKMVWLNLLQFLIALAYTALIVIAFAAEGKLSFKFMKATGNRWTMLGLIAAAGINLFIAYFVMSCKKTKVLALVRSIFMVGIAAGIYVIALMAKVDYIDTLMSWMLYAIIAAVAALIISILPLLKKKEKKAVAIEEPAPVEEVVEEPEATEEAEEEEIAEAVVYEGGPIPVEMAEECEPEVEEEPAPIVIPPVQTADYDYYNSRSFDPFIASLSNEERNQFTELFILHYKGTLDALPEYEVGGNNKAFFQAIFINLGLYRDRIPDGLLEKIYKFAIKL